MEKQAVVYLLASSRNGTLYVGVTSSLVARIFQHRNDIVEGFTSRHGVHILVWYEPHFDMIHAITREKQIKKWTRTAKIRLVEKANPNWHDLWPQLVSG